MSVMLSICPTWLITSIKNDLFQYKSRVRFEFYQLVRTPAGANERQQRLTSTLQRVPDRPVGSHCCRPVHVGIRTHGRPGANSGGHDSGSVLPTGRSYKQNLIVPIYTYLFLVIYYNQSNHLENHSIDHDYLI